MMKLRLAKPGQLVDLQDLSELRAIRSEPGTLVIGAMTTQHELIGSDLLAARCPIICETSLLIADPQVRYCGTLGGNLANGDPGNDMPSVMLALGAIYRAQGPQGERDIPAREYYRGIYSTALLDGEILSSIRVPTPADHHGWAYEKQKRKVGDYATAAAAVIVTMVNGVCTSAAIALTNLADTPLFAQHAGEALVGGCRRGGDCRSRAAGAADHEPFGRRTWASRFPRPCRGGDGAAGDCPSHRARPLKRGTAMAKMHIKLTVNNRDVEILAEPRLLLIHLLREELGITGPHIGCDTSHCGACTVDMNGKSVKSCTVFAVQASGAEITTVEGLVGTDGSLNPLQEAFREHHGLQCGFCTPGMITRAYRLLQENPNPSEAEIRHGISGNLCRCTGYQTIVRAIRAAAEHMSSAREAAE